MRSLRHAPLVSALATLVAACSSSIKSSPSSSPPLGPTVSVSGGSITWYQGADPSHVKTGSAYVAAYLAHWGGDSPIAVTVEPLGSIPERGAGWCIVEDLENGSVGGLEWEAPLVAQGVVLYDPPTPGTGGTTWGNSGPLFVGQAAWAVARTNEPLSVRHAP